MWILRESVVRDNFLCFITSVGCDVNILCWNIIVPNLEYFIHCSGLHVRVWNAYLRSVGQFKE